MSLHENIYLSAHLKHLKETVQKSPITYIFLKKQEILT